MVIFQRLAEYAAVCYLFGINLIAFAAFGRDKQKARKGQWRISERRLILLALLGGSAGALIGMYLFHHKTRKRKFTVGVPLIFLVQIALTALICRY